MAGRQNLLIAIIQCRFWIMWVMAQPVLCTGDIHDARWAATTSIWRDAPSHSAGWRQLNDGSGNICKSSCQQQDKILKWWAPAAAHLQQVTRPRRLRWGGYMCPVPPPSWCSSVYLERVWILPTSAPSHDHHRPPSHKKCIILVYIRVGYYIKCNYCTKEERKSLWGDDQFYFFWSSSFFLDT